MKKIFIYAVMLLGVLPFTSCDNNLPEEQFSKMVLLTKNGFQEYNIEFTAEGTVDLGIPVSINGTSKNSKTVHVSLELAPDTLEAYNFERYRNRTSLYYQLPSENMYSFPEGAETTIEAGSDFGIVPLRLNLKNFDLYNSYVLPLKIASVSDYQLAWSKYSKVLMKLNITNFFSGNYSVDGKAWEESFSDQKLPISSATLRALSSNQCYLYAGNVSESDEDKAGYTFAIEVDKNVYEDSVEPSTDANVRKYTAVTISSKNTDKQVKDESGGRSWVEVSKSADPVNKNLENIVTKVYLKYSYMNLRDAGYPVKMFFEGTFTRSESIDIRTGKPATN